MPTHADAIAELAAIRTMPPQLWVDLRGDRGMPARERMDKAADDHTGRPHGGLWTSTYRDGDHSSPFIDTLRATAGDVPTVSCPAWILTPRRSPIWEISDSHGMLDLMVLADGAGPIWPQVAGQVAGVHMTAQGAKAFPTLPVDDGRPALHAARMEAVAYLTETGAGGPLAWWYSECTYWCRWGFSEVARTAPIDVPDVF